jgi:hypothetical protein
MGPAFLFQDGHYLDNERTFACAACIESLRASHPWVDAVDLKIFLKGFEAGEGYSTSLYQGQNIQDVSKTHAST